MRHSSSTTKSIHTACEIAGEVGQHPPSGTRHTSESWRSDWLRFLMRCMCALVTGILTCYGGADQPLAAHAGESEETQQLVRPCDAVWEFCTRRIPENCEADMSRLVVRRLVNCQWTSSDEASMLDSLLEATDATAQPLEANQDTPPSVITSPVCVFYVHGNWTDAATARARGLLLYQHLRRFDPRPIRLVIFSWPSTREHGAVKDIYEKAMRLDFEAFLLAQLLRKLPSQVPLGLVGYSFGGAITAGALHLDAGGRYGCYTLGGDRVVRSVRVMWLAPAFDRDALRPCGEFSRTLDQCEHVYNYYNSCDPVLKRYRFIDPQRRPEAAGFAGVSPRSRSQGTSPLTHDFRIKQFNCCCSIGRTHSELSYLKCLCNHPEGLMHLVSP